MESAYKLSNQAIGVKHSLQKVYQNCENCGSDDSLDRIPGEIFLSKKQSEFTERSEAGMVVKSAIEEAKEDLIQEKKVHKNKVYKK
jgi:hypothetical protein